MTVISPDLDGVQGTKNETLAPRRMRELEATVERERQSWAEERGRLLAEASLKSEELASLSSLAFTAGDGGVTEGGSSGEGPALRGELRRLRNALSGVNASDERIYYDCAQTLHLVTVSL
jgi:hypothetical protein